MKLRNKKTGKVLEMDIHCIGGKVYESLSGISEDWEDYEEPKEYWYLENNGDVDSFRWDGDDYDKRMMLIGNCFSSKEEAEEAVEKLKAWKRLKDKGFRFDGFDVANRGGDNVICGQAYFKAGNYDREEIKSDLNICFGGEE